MTMYFKIFLVDRLKPNALEFEFGFLQDSIEFS